LFARIKDKIIGYLLSNETTRRAWVRGKLKVLQPGSKLLDAGAGQQPYRADCGHLRYFSQDFGEYSPQGQGLQIKDWRYEKLDYRGQVWDIKEQDGFFDVVLCTEVLEHVPFPNETLQEFSRLLKPGGILLLTAPYACLPHMQPYFYYSGFSREYYQMMLEKHQFDIGEITANGNFFLYLVQENMRGLRVIHNPLLKMLYLSVFILPILLMRLLAKAVPDEQLVLGYHVQAVKRAHAKR